MFPTIVQIEPGSETLPSRKGASFAARGLALLVAAVAVGPCLTACAPKSPSGPAAEQSQGPGGPFQLVDQNGRAADQSVLEGKWTVVFFGYTFCPDFCPTALTTLGRAIDQLGPKGDQVQVVFITVDPNRDTPSQLKTYLSSKVFPKHIIGLTGSSDRIAQAARAYDVYYQKDGDGPNYSVDHSTALYLMDPKGRFRRVIAEGLTPDEVSRQISEAMSGA
jgi:protein SCO1/2